MRTRTALGRLAGAALLVGSLSGCGATVDSGEVTDQVDAAIDDAAGQEPDATDCPEELDAEEGATTTCTVTVADEEFEIGVEVTGVEGDTADFDVEVPEDLRPSAVPAADVAEQVSVQLAETIGGAPPEVTCPEDLPAEEGAVVTCLLTDGADEFDTEVAVSSVDGTTVNFDIQVADQPNP